MGLFITCRSCFSSSVVIFGLIFPPATGTKHKNFRGPPANAGLSHTAGGCHHWKLPLRTIVPVSPSAVLSFHLRRKRTIESNLFCAVQALYYLVKDGHAKWRHTQTIAFWHLETKQLRHAQQPEEPHDSQQWSWHVTLKVPSPRRSVTHTETNCLFSLEAEILWLMLCMNTQCRESKLCILETQTS